MQQNRNSNRIMEIGHYFKNGRLQKLGIATMVALVMMSAMSCAPVYVEKLKADVIGFSNDATTSFNEGSYKVKFVGQSVRESGIWAINSEYNAQSGTMKNAYIMVILDCSLSFKNVFVDAQETILDIVNFISNKK